MLKSAIADGIRLLVALVLIGLGLMLAKDYVAPADESRLDTAEADNTILRVDG